MAHPHYLMQAASGRYVFRIRVPSPLRTKVWQAFLKRSLGMDLLPARVAALALSARHAAAFTAMQEMGMSDVNMASAWECSRNDIFEGVAVLLAALAVWAFGAGWPDLLIAAVLLVMFLRSALRVLRSAWREMRAQG